MATHRIETFADDALSVPGHECLVAFNHNTRAQAVSCDNCGANIGRFPPGRWREKRIREAWQQHLTEAGA